MHNILTKKRKYCAHMKFLGVTYTYDCSVAHNWSKWPNEKPNPFSRGKNPSTLSRQVIPGFVTELH